ncbi:MAG: hypothetical protein COA49_01980 [Bacteroidetes bacterium]|nr:MAG: hypothetical protein COA49_01980 [Bacteroidota bacterium]
MARRYEMMCGQTYLWGMSLTMNFKIFLPILIVISTCFLSGCEYSDLQVDEHHIIKAEYAEGFRWVKLNNVSWLECLNPESNEVLSRVVRDSSDLSLLPEEMLTKFDFIVLCKGERLATLSTTHVALIEKSVGLEHWAGGAFISYLQSESALEKIKNGTALDLGGNPEINREMCVLSKPSALLIYPFGDPLNGDGEVFGIPVIPITEYLEPSPLGRAEWMRVIGWLVGEEEKSDLAFKEIAEKYNRLRKEVHRNNSNVPIVFTGSVKEGKWNAPGGGSLVARFIEDAGGKYLFNGGRENISMELESVISAASDADIWGMVVYAPEGYSKSKLVMEDPRHSYLIPKSGKVFYCNTATTDYFGSMIVQPEVVLADLISLIRPDLAGDTLFLGPKTHEEKTFKWLPE